MTERKKNFTILILLAALGLFFGVASARIKSANGFTPPMKRYGERPKLLRFGMHVTPDPAQNPIDPPERFEGYHTALDLEVFDDEKDREVPVFAACKGPIVEKSVAEGYGGVIIQRCALNGQAVTVLYGHLDISSVSMDNGHILEPKQYLGILGENKSAETSFTREHLHFQIHKGENIELAGYVQTETDLTNYINPEDVLK